MSHQIAPERRKTPWWVWLLAALAALLLIWLLVGLLDDNDDEAAVGADDPAQIDDADADAGVEATDPADGQSNSGGGDGAEGPITDLAVFTGDSSGNLAGRSFELDGVQVQSVPGDKTFWVGPSQDQQVFAFLQEEEGAGGDAVEGAVDVNPGDQVRLSGTVRELPPLDEARSRFELDDNSAASLENEQFFLEVQKVEPAG